MAQQFPQDIYRQLEGVDYRLIDELSFLSNLQAQRTGSRYCIPGRKYLARKLGVCVRTISRHITKLRKLGVIDAIQRRPVGGIFQTNLYRLYPAVEWAAKRTISLIRDAWDTAKKKLRAEGSTSKAVPAAHFHRETHVARIAKKKGITLLNPKVLEKNPILKRWMERGGEN